MRYTFAVQSISVFDWQKFFCFGFLNNMNIAIKNPVISSETQGVFSRCHSLLNELGKINAKSVQNLSAEKKNFLINNSPKRITELAKLNCFAANKIKTVLDKTYGEGKYTVIAIGRSISSIVELLGHMGVDTKIIPLSGLRRGNIDEISPESLHTYKTFLVQKGLSKTNLAKNKDKTYILMDYTFYGRSIKKAEQLLKREELLGNAKNLISMPISDILGKDYSEMGFEKLFEYCRFKDYSYVGKLNIEKLENVYQECSPKRVPEFRGNITQGIRKLFWFNVFEIMQKKNFINNVLPIKEIEALYNHHLSPKAIQNYLRREINKEVKNIEPLK